ncbi:sensor histidine kinase [Jejuia pallidilutea]|uniref:histidine kinase n=1 Tax=Jejuia pallidilutea TaxID=504487 RepID=A0A090VKQ9_9FLAO|nr:sensor histidine kinase [Jejuia pallidilutea]GAL65345.1 sensory box histidine kinase [Jejuia pallidilutea]GAL69407.1 sensory box histidine kinase [Jejuia pallidilutea]GAL89081.1 sensory box histidine kinase [Jejuia pallidilutea]
MVVIILSVTFYNQFSEVLQERIIQQLNSIKTLKQNQIDKLIQSEWQNFNSSSNSKTLGDSINFKLPNKVLKAGIYDFTAYNTTHELTIGMVNVKNDTQNIKFIPYHKIKNILLERTGMGETGESYIVGEDFRMRSQSRFFKDSLPHDIIVKTIGVANALEGKYGKGLYKDYRNVDVYGVYGLIDISELKLAILSEIDKDEVEAPLTSLKKRLFALIFLIMGVAIFLSLFLTRIIANPILNMKNSLKIMADGNYTHTDTFAKNSYEIIEMFNALDSLKKSLKGAVDFSKDIGNMNLNTNYSLKSKNDALGKSLIKMRDKLKEFRNNENISRINAKRLLVEGLENERQRLSRELHDGLGPLLTTLKFFIDNKVEDTSLRFEMRKMVDDTISEIRIMSNALMPSTIYDFGVGAALANYIADVKKAWGISIKFENLLKQHNSKITKNQEIHIFRICQELINNTLKYAEANTIRISLSEFDDFISLFYFDDGKGFNMDTAKTGSGIINIKERVEICNGKIKINSKPGSTTFDIEFSIKNENN